MSGVALPAHVRAVFLRGAVVRALRDALDGLDAGAVGLVAGRGASVPELPRGARWRDAGDVRVAAVSREYAAGLATFRAGAAGEQLAGDPPPRCRWCIYLDAGLRCAVVPLPIAPPSSAPTTPPEAA